MSLTRLMAVFPDGTSMTIDAELNGNPPMTAFKPYETVHFAELVVSVNLTTGETKVLKNRYGDTGRVEQRREFVR